MTTPRPSPTRRRSGVRTARVIAAGAFATAMVGTSGAVAMRTVMAATPATTTTTVDRAGDRSARHRGAGHRTARHGGTRRGGPRRRGAGRGHGGDRTSRDRSPGHRHARHRDAQGQANAPHHRLHREQVLSPGCPG